MNVHNCDIRRDLAHLPSIPAFDGLKEEQVTWEATCPVVGQLEDTMRVTCIGCAFVEISVGACHITEGAEKP